MSTFGPQRALSRLLLVASTLPLAACSGIQSSLSPSGREAARVADLFWWMTIVAVLVWVGVIALALYYTRTATGVASRRRDRLLIVGGGVLLPTVTVTILLVYSLAMLPETVARAPEGSLQVDVVGEQWWCRVRYRRPDGREAVLANEVRLPVGEPVQFRLESDNVIHSFWIPSLAGKMDMIPGRITYLTLRPTATGVFRGACAEYCGTSHALDAHEYTALARGTARDSDAGDPMEDLLGATSVPPAIVESCGRCHRVNGLGRGLGAFPRLAGQRPAYLLASMQAYARGERHSGIMEPVAASLGFDEMQQLSEYYSRLPQRSLPNALGAEGADVERGRTIASNGVPENLVPACVTCHGPGAHRRNPVYPVIAGQYSEYIRLQLSLLKAGHRGGTPFRNIMRRVASQLTEDQMRDVAAYYAALPAGS